MSIIRKLNSAEPAEKHTADPLETSGAAGLGSQTDDVVLSVRNVTKEFIQLHTNRHILALHDISFDVQQDQFVSIVGRSGCGKSTLLRMIAGLMPPTKGGVYVNGKLVRGPGADRGMVFQEYAVFPWKTALENVEFPLLVQGFGKGERHERAMHFLDLVNLTDAAGLYPRELSGGMKQRVAVARSLCQQPTVLLMDEPFAAIDAVQRQQLQEELARICAETRTTVVFVTHSVDEAAFLSDRVIVLKASPGEVIADIRVDLPEQRNWSDLSENSEFNELRAALLQEIQRGSQQNDEGVIGDER